MTSKSHGATAVTLLSNGELRTKSVFTDNGYRRELMAYLDTLALGEGDPGLLLADDEDVALTGSERVVNGVLEVDDVETSIVALTVGDDTNTTHVTTTCDHGDNTSVELDEVGDLASGEVNLHGVVDLDSGVGVANAIVLLSACMFSATIHECCLDPKFEYIQPGIINRNEEKSFGKWMRPYERYGARTKSSCATFHSTFPRFPSFNPLIPGILPKLGPTAE